MSTEERIKVLEEKGEELVEPEIHCVFCHEITGWHTAYAGYEFVIKKLNITECNHDKLGIESWWFADFISGALLHEIISNYNRDQTNPEKIRQVLSNYSIMEKAFDTYAEEQKKLTENVYKHCESWWKEYWKYRISIEPYFLEQAKLLYQDNVKILEIPTRKDLAMFEWYNLKKLKNLN